MAATKHLTVAEVAALHCATKSAVYLWIKSELLGAVEQDGRLFVSLREARAFRRPKRGRPRKVRQA